MFEKIKSKIADWLNLTLQNENNELKEQVQILEARHADETAFYQSFQFHRLYAIPTDESLMKYLPIANIILTLITLIFVWKK